MATHPQQQKQQQQQLAHQHEQKYAQQQQETPLQQLLLQQQQQHVHHHRQPAFSNMAPTTSSFPDAAATPGTAHPPFLYASNRLSPVAVLACCAYGAASTLVTLLNKVVFSDSRFHYPWTTLAVQNVLSVLLIAVARACGMTRAGRYSRRLARDMTVPVICFVLFIFTNALSMRYISIPVLTVWKSLGPMFVTLFERFYFGDVFSPRVYAAMALIVLSALVTAINDLEYSLVGYLWAAANVLANVAYLASLRKYLRSPRISALDKTFHSNLISLLPMAVMAVAMDETPRVVQDFRTTSGVFKAVFVLSGFLTTAVCASAFWVISLTNGSTLSFIGGMNKIPMILVSLLVFDTRMSWAGWFGVALGIIAGIVFMRAKSVVPQTYVQGQATGKYTVLAKGMFGGGSGGAASAGGGGMGKSDTGSEVIDREIRDDLYDDAYDVDHGPVSEKLALNAFHGTAQQQSSTPSTMSSSSPLPTPANSGGSPRAKGFGSAGGSGSNGFIPSAVLGPLMAFMRKRYDLAAPGIAHH